MSYMAYQLNDLSKRIAQNIDLFIHFFDLDLREDEKGYHGCCPIHADSDNNNAFSFYTDHGNWICRTHHCEEIFKKSALGFIRGILSAKKLGWENASDTDKIYDFHQTVRFAEQLLEKRPTTKFQQPDKHKRNTPKKAKPSVELKVPIKHWLDNVTCPSKYFLDRGFHPQILEKYCVGDYEAKYKLLSGRAVVPIFNNDGTLIIGASGRLPHDKCLVCGGYHHSRLNCPSREEEGFAKQKWIHSKGFQRKNYLYNFWSAKHYIARTSSIVLVEGPADIWKLEEAGIKNGCAIFGSNVTQEQRDLIKTVNCHNIITMMDNDEGGDVARLSCENLFKDMIVEHKIPTANDLGDMSISEIKELYND